jgi:hypothetical protein
LGRLKVRPGWLASSAFWLSQQLEKPDERAQLRFMKNLYLDIDGVLSTAKHTQAAPGVDEFVELITQHFTCYWLTTHCKGDSAPALRYLSGFLKSATLEKLRQTVRPTNWDTLKTEAIDLTSDFYWLDDSPFQAEIAYLQAHGVADKLLVVKLSNANELHRLPQLLS